MWAFVDLGEGKIGLTQAALIGAGITLLAIFVWHEGRTPHPILPLSFFHHAGYASSISSSFLAFFSGFGVSSYLPLAVNAAFHENRAIVGLVVGAFTIGWSSFVFTAGRSSFIASANACRAWSESSFIFSGFSFSWSRSNTD